jgi:hypothetical protein
VHQVQWIKGYGESRAAVLEAFARQVERLGHADNWFEWELAFAPRSGVETRAAGCDDRLLALWAEARAWERAALAEACGQVRLGGPAPVCIAPLRALEPEDIAALQVEPATGAFVARLRARIDDPEVAPPGVDPQAFAYVARLDHEQREVTLAWLEERSLEGFPFLREAAPVDWPAHLVGAPRDGELHYVAVDMHL